VAGGPVTRTLEFAGVCLPARHVGGDYYDFLDLGQQRLGLVMVTSPEKALLLHC
jgi:serine phosphatase RsbU (regulator of sigma subunit)